LCVYVVGYKIINLYKPPPSLLTPAAILTFPPTSQYDGDFDCQHVNWGYNKTCPDDESLDYWATSNNLGLLSNPNEAVSFSSHRRNVYTNPDLALASFGQDNRLPDRRVLGNFPRSQHRPSRIMPPRLKVPTHSDPVKRWNFRKADWNRFCLLLTGESVQRLPPPDATNVEKAYQELCESLLSATKQCTPRGRLKKYMQCWTKSARSFIAPSSEPQFVLTLTEPLPIYFLGSNRRGRSDGNKLSIPSNSRTPAARRGAPRMNLLACLDAPPLCTPSQQTPSSHNS